VWHRGKPLIRTVAAISERFQSMSFQAKNGEWTNFSSRLPELGDVEAFVEGEVKITSVQGRITPSGEVKSSPPTTKS